MKKKKKHNLFKKKSNFTFNLEIKCPEKKIFAFYTRLPVFISLLLIKKTIMLNFFRLKKKNTRCHKNFCKNYELKYFANKNKIKRIKYLNTFLEGNKFNKNAEISMTKNF